VVTTLVACARTNGPAEPARLAALDASTPQAEDAASVVHADPQIERDGDDDPAEIGEGQAPTRGHFVRVGRAPLALRRVCDLTVLAGALYAAHANQPLGTDGATISRYDPTAEPKRAFTVAFDWNRPGEPVRGGGAGQGFVRAHAIDGRLFVPDADPPYDGFHILDHGTEGYVFISDHAGKLAPARGAHFRPPAAPDAEDRPGAGILPRAYHVLDAIKFRGRYYASTGSVPPSERAWRGPSPGALHVASADLSRWTYEVDYPFPYKDGVWRLGFLVRFKDRLYAGIQDYDGREPNDFLYFDPPAGATAIARADVHPVRIVGTAQTIRWYADPQRPRLFWISFAADGVRLRVTEDGDAWTAIALPEGVGRPTDLVRFRSAMLVLTERALLRLGDDGALTEIARIADKKTPFELSDVFCAAPLAVFNNQLYAGGQRDGALFRLDED
jgi:hypothetical protein